MKMTLSTALICLFWGFQSIYAQSTNAPVLSINQLCSIPDDHGRPDNIQANLATLLGFPPQDTYPCKEFNHHLNRPGSTHSLYTITINGRKLLIIMDTSESDRWMLLLDQAGNIHKCLWSLRGKNLEDIAVNDHKRAEAHVDFDKQFWSPIYFGFQGTQK